MRPHCHRISLSQYCILSAPSARPLVCVQMLTSLVRGWVASSLAQCQFIRYIGDVLREMRAPGAGASDPEVEASLWKALEGGLGNINERVQYEAARVILSLPDKARVAQAVEGLLCCCCYYCAWATLFPLLWGFSARPSLFINVSCHLCNLYLVRLLLVLSIWLPPTFPFCIYVGSLAHR